MNYKMNCSICGVESYKHRFHVLYNDFYICCDDCFRDKTKVFKCVGCDTYKSHKVEEKSIYVKEGFCCTKCAKKVKYRFRKLEKPSFDALNSRSDDIPSNFVEDDEYSDMSELEMRAIDSQNRERNNKKTNSSSNSISYNYNNSSELAAAGIESEVVNCTKCNTSIYYTDVYNLFDGEYCNKCYELTKCNICNKHSLSCYKNYYGVFCSLDCEKVGKLNYEKKNSLNLHDLPRLTLSSAREFSKKDSLRYSTNLGKLSMMTNYIPKLYNKCEINKYQGLPLVYLLFENNSMLILNATTVYSLKDGVIKIVYSVFNDNEKGLSDLLKLGEINPNLDFLVHIYDGRRSIEKFKNN